MTKPKRTSYQHRKQAKKDEFPYSAQSRLITPAELRFLHTGLEPALKDRFYIGVQVPMTSVIKVEESQWDKAAGRKIRLKRLDFVLAYPRTFKIAAVIELDDLSHQLEHRKKRDHFVEQAFAAAGVLLVRISVYKKYDPKLIRSIINRELKRHRENKSR